MTGNFRILLILGLLATSPAFCQRSQAARTAADPGNSDLPALRRITVTGQAEKEVTPDIIYVSLTIREYFGEGSPKQKMPLEELEKSFLRKVYDAGIKPAALSIEGVSGQINSGKRKKDDQFLASKRYQIKLSDLDRLNSLLASLDQKALSNVYVSRYEYSKMEEERRELRIKALQDARGRAAYMLESLNESLGEPLAITEGPDENNSGPMAAVFQSRMADDSSSPEINFKKINISVSVKVTFKIK